MRVLLIGVGTVGESIARLAATPWCGHFVLADYDTAGRSPGRPATTRAVPVEHIDARDRAPSPRWRRHGLTWS
jgi:hypothetical protein